MCGFPLARVHTRAAHGSHSLVATEIIQCLTFMTGLPQRVAAGGLASPFLLEGPIYNTPEACVTPSKLRLIPKRELDVLVVALGLWEVP